MGIKKTPEAAALIPDSFERRGDVSFNLENPDLSSLSAVEDSTIIFLRCYCPGSLPRNVFLDCLSCLSLFVLAEGLAKLFFPTRHGLSPKSAVLAIRGLFL